MDKLIITVALTGNVPTRAMNANLPTTSEEIGADARRCADAGATIFHVHARDANRAPTLDIEVFEAGMVSNALYLQKKGLLEAPLHFNFVLGAPGAMPGTVRSLVFLAESVPAGSTWTVAGIGKAELPLAAAAIAMGGHVRVGLSSRSSPCPPH